MQSGYGEMQQFMVDASLFSSPSNASPPPRTPNPLEMHHHPLSLQHPLQHFAHFGHPVPITQQLLQHQQTHHPHHHQFQLFHPSHQHHQQQQHMRLDQGLEPDNPRGSTSFLAAMNFKLGVSENSGGGGGGSRDNGLNDDDGILHGGDDDGSDESRLHHHHHPWPRDDDQSAPNIKQPFWRPLDIDFINPNNKRPSKDKQPEPDIPSNIKHFKKSNEVLDQDANYKLFSELEEIYKPGSTPITGGSGGGPGGGTGTNHCNNQTGSGSALTGDDNPLMPVTTPIEPTVDNISDTSNGGDAPPLPVLNKQFQKGSGGGGDRRKRAKRRLQRQLASITTFFESLVKQLMDHQEKLHRRFLEVMEKRDQERTSREEAWRKQESAKANREAAARAQERDLAASRESAIIAFLEKISGESLNLPISQSQHQNIEEHDANLEINNHQSSEVELYRAPDNNVGNNNYDIVTASGNPPGSCRWPKVEVQALIQVRSGFESRFQEPGLKGPLWEEVSLAMSSLGYSRSAKRCKEKWENINKYFRKAKDSGKKRPQHSKTCPYFQQLDQLYSKSNNATSSNEERKAKTNSELLDAIVVSNEGTGKRNVDKEFINATNEGDDDDEDEDEDGEEGQGESQELEQAQGQEDLNNRDETAHFLMNQ